MERKEKIHLSGKLPIYHEREIWWIAIGENIGAEINGKGADLLRPVLIIRKNGDFFSAYHLVRKFTEGCGMIDSNIRVSFNAYCFRKRALLALIGCGIKWTGCLCLAFREYATR